MTPTSVLAVAFGIGIVAGLRSMTAPAVVSWAARLKWINLDQSSLAFMGNAVTPYIFSVLAVLELIADKLPKTPSRKSIGPFAGRIIIGAFSGAAFAIGAAQSAALGAVLGGVGAVAGTLGGYEVRTRLVRSLKVPDLVIALLEDVVAVAVGLFLVSRSS